MDAIPAPHKARGDSAHQCGGGVPLLGMLFKLVDGHRDRRVALGYDADAAVIIFSGGSLCVERYRRGEDKPVLVIRVVAAKLRAPRRGENVLCCPPVLPLKFCLQFPVHKCSSGKSPGTLRGFLAVLFYFAPGLPSMRNMFFLYSSTPGWLKGLTRDMYPDIAQAISKKQTSAAKPSSSRRCTSMTMFGTPPVCALP